MPVCRALSLSCDTFVATGEATGAMGGCTVSLGSMTSTGRTPEDPRAGERGSAAVEYVGLALVVSMLMTAIATAVDSALGDQLAHAIVTQLVHAVNRAG